MRFLVREQRYEKGLASGQYRYEAGGEATGVVENWRLNEAVAGYRILRSDVDGRAAVGADSFLYHLLYHEEEGPERLTFRRWGAQGDKVEGNLFFEKERVICGRTVNGARVAESVLQRPDPLIFWSAGTALFSTTAAVQPGQHAALYLNPAIDLALAEVTVLVADDGEAELKLNRPVTTRKRDISWAGEMISLWFDEYNWPIKMQQGGLVATNHRYVRRSRS